jgi:hypothetical protein
MRIVEKEFQENVTVDIFNLYLLSAGPANAHVSAGSALHFFNTVKI